jgi:hypothetical protein
VLLTHYICFSTPLSLPCALAVCLRSKQGARRFNDRSACLYPSMINGAGDQLTDREMWDLYILPVFEAPAHSYGSASISIVVDTVICGRH